MKDSAQMLGELPKAEGIKEGESGETDGRAAPDYLNMESGRGTWRGGRKGVAGVMLA